MPSVFLWGPTRIIQYESNRYESAEYATRNQLTDIFKVADRNIRDLKTSQVDGIKRAGGSTKVPVVAIGTSNRG